MYRVSALMVPCTCALLLAACRASRSQSAPGPSAVPVTVGTASTQAAPLEIKLVGTVEPSSKVEVKSLISGQLLSVHFNEGQDVREGQLLFKIDPQPYRESVRQAEAALERDRAILNQAESAVQRDIVQSKAAEAEAARYETLLKERLVSSQQNLQYRTTADAMKETIRADQAAVQSARASLNVDQALLDRAKLDLSYTDIHAPIAGRAGNLLVHAGNLVKANDVPLVVVNRIKPVFVSFNVPEHHLEAIRRYSAGSELPLRVTSRGDPPASITGHLSVIDNTVDTQTGTVHLKGKFDNASGQLWPGQFVNVALTLNNGQSATVVPAEAVQAGQQGQFVYVVKPDRTVEPRVVAVGRTLERNVIIDKGVNPGETIVTDGQMLLFPGAHIAVVPAPKRPAGAQ